MLIHEICKITGLTRKAVEYYREQGLISPLERENGYREFTDSDAERLQKIAVLRRLDVPVERIRAILSDESGSELRATAVQARLDAQASARRQELLERLSGGADYALIGGELLSADRQRAIIDRLTDVFPGIFGQYLALHFARFLAGKIETAEQEAAWETMVGWLDDAPPLPEGIRAWFEAATAGVGGQALAEMSDRMYEVMSDGERFRAAYERGKALQADFAASPVAGYIADMKAFLEDSGYYRTFIPALRRLSPEYDAYSIKLHSMEALLQ